jgi:hypothetical protein
MIVPLHSAKFIVSLSFLNPMSLYYPFSDRDLRGGPSRAACGCMYLVASIGNIASLGKLVSKNGGRTECLDLNGTGKPTEEAIVPHGREILAPISERVPLRPPSRHVATHNKIKIILPGLASIPSEDVCH